MAELQPRAKVDTKRAHVYLERKVHNDLRYFCDNEHPLRPTITSAVEVAVCEWLERERKKLLDEHEAENLRRAASELTDASKEGA